MDAEFSRAAVNARWATALEDVRISAANLEWIHPLELGGIRVYPPGSGWPGQFARERLDPSQPH
jgi:hypothetical protein